MSPGRMKSLTPVRAVWLLIGTVHSGPMRGNRKNSTSISGSDCSTRILARRTVLRLNWCSPGRCSATSAVVTRITFTRAYATMGRSWLNRNSVIQMK